MTNVIVIVIGILGLLGVSIFLLRRTPLGCIVFSCMPEVIACLRDEESRKGLQELISCDARLFLVYATTQIPQPRIDSIVLIVSRTPHLSAESEISMKRAVKERGLEWDHFFVLDNDRYQPAAPVIPFQLSNL